MRVQVTTCPAMPHVQPFTVPVGAVGVSPAGTVSVTVTVVPFVAAVPELVTVTL